MDKESLQFRSVEKTVQLSVGYKNAYASYIVTGRKDQWMHATLSIAGRAMRSMKIRTGRNPLLEIESCHNQRLPS
ncbi:MAG: hypothetical protein IH811_11985 [Proteobacteria bacterium]|nr:hypothetical protein [Pseudomonadota bacterium]